MSACHVAVPLLTFCMTTTVLSSLFQTWWCNNTDGSVEGAIITSRLIRQCLFLKSWQWKSHVVFVFHGIFVLQAVVPACSLRLYLKHVSFSSSWRVPTPSKRTALMQWKVLQGYITKPRSWTHVALLLVQETWVCLLGLVMRPARTRQHLWQGAYINFSF